MTYTFRDLVMLKKLLRVTEDETVREAIEIRIQSVKRYLIERSSGGEI